MVKEEQFEEETGIGSEDSEDLEVETEEDFEEEEAVEDSIAEL